MLSINHCIYVKTKKENKQNDNFRLPHEVKILLNIYQEEGCGVDVPPRSGGPLL